MNVMAKSNRAPCVLGLLFTAAALAAAGGGCGGKEKPPPPKTYPVTGKVVYADGKPMKGGTIEFRSVADPTLTMMGDIGDDGTFSLRTLHDNAKLSGAIEGEHRVTILPQSKDQTTPPIQLTQTFKIKAQDTNQISIKLEQNSPRQ
jgi:hypothetical protein